MPAVDELSRTFGALAHPTRRSILARLARGEATVTELADPFEMSQQAVSKHLKVLEQAGLVGRTGPTRYQPRRLEPAPLQAAADWITEHRQLWEQRYDQLDDHLATLGFDTPDEQDHS